MTQKILLIDDEANLLAGLRRTFRKEFDILTAEGGEAGLAALKDQGPFAVVVSDMRMPGLDGVETLARAAEQAPDTVRMMLTGNADQDTAVEAINQGRIFRFLNKPASDDVLRQAFKDALRQYELVTAEQTLLEQTLKGSIQVLMDVLSMTEPEAYGTAARARDWLRHVATEESLKLPWEVEMAVMLSPLGLVSVPPEVLKKRSEGQALNEAEAAMLSAVPDTGSRLIREIPRMEGVADMVRLQACRYDGADGGVSGEEIPFGARLIRAFLDLASFDGSTTPSSTALGRIKAEEAAYDPRILGLITKHFGSADAIPAEEPGVGNSVTVDLLVSGDKLLSDIMSQSGKLLLAAGNRLSAPQIERLKNIRKLDPIVEPIEVRRPKAA